MNKRFLQVVHYSALVLITTAILGFCDVLEAKDKVFLVGVDKFDNLSQLEGACNDVDALAKLLSDRFEVVVLKDVTTKDFLVSLRDFNRGLTPDETALYVFATHGFISTGGGSYLCFADTTVNENSQPIKELCIAADQLVSAAQETKARNCAFIFDVCRVGERSSAFKLSSPARLKKATCIMYSCPLGSPSIENEAMKRGRFMLRFCEGLRGAADRVVGNCDSNVSYMEAFQYCDAMAKEAKEDAPTLDGSLRDAFSLVLTNSTLTEEESANFLKERGLVELKDLLELQTELERQRNIQIANKEAEVIAKEKATNPRQMQPNVQSETPTLDNIITRLDRVQTRIDRGMQIYNRVWGVINSF